MPIAPPPAANALTTAEAAALVRRGDTLMVGGFGLVGKPLQLVQGLLTNPEATGLTVMAE